MTGGQHRTETNPLVLRSSARAGHFAQLRGHWAMFEVMNHNGIEGAFEVRGHGDRAGEVAIFLGPRARERAAAYVQRERGSGLPAALDRSGLHRRGRPRTQ
jgi:uncharacterized membrane protein